jgi:hypothetical protein
MVGTHLLNRRAVIGGLWCCYQAQALVDTAAEKEREVVNKATQLSECRVA